MKKRDILSVLVLMGLTASSMSHVDAASTGAYFIGIGPINPPDTAQDLKNKDGGKATGDNALAIGVNAQGSALNSIAVGTTAQATAASSVAMGTTAQASTINSIAIGNTAKVNNEGGSAIGGIAIGHNAYSHNMSNGNHESIIQFGRDKASLALTGGIAIDQDTHARIGNVELGNRDYRGQIGDFDFATTDGKIGGTAIDNNGKLKKLRCNHWCRFHYGG